MEETLREDHQEATTTKDIQIRIVDYDFMPELDYVGGVVASWWSSRGVSSTDILFPQVDGVSFVSLG